MAAITFRESNQALWRGSRPGHDGVQVSKHIKAEGTTLDLFQVDSSKVACINTIVLSCLGSGSGNIGLFHTDSLNTIIARIVNTVYVANQGFQAVCVVFPEPLELINEEKLRVYSSAANVEAIGYCKGRQE